MTNGLLFSVTIKNPNNNQYGIHLISDSSNAFSKVMTPIDDVNKRFAAGNVEIKNSITEAKHEILTSVAAVEQVADAAKLQADTNAFQLKELQKKFDKLQREFCYQSKEIKLCSFTVDAITLFSIEFQITRKIPMTSANIHCFRNTLK